MHSDIFEIESEMQPIGSVMVGAAVGAGTLLLLLLPTLAFSLDYDQGMLQYVGWGVVQGWWPYEEVWDTAFPGGVLLHAAVIALFGNSAVALRAVDLVWQLTTALALYRVGRRISGIPAGCYAALSYAVAYRAAGPYQTAQRDGFLVLPLLVAVLAYLAYLQVPKKRPLVIAALGVGIVTLFRPTYAVLGIAGSAHLVLSALRAGKTRDSLRDAAWFAALSAAPLLVFFAALPALGHRAALGDLLESLRTVYPHLERFSAARVLQRGFEAIPALTWVGVGAASVLLAREARLLLALAALCFGIRLWEAKGFQYQYWPILALLVTVSGAGWTALFASRGGSTDKPRPPPRWRMGALLSLALVAQYLAGPRGGYRAVRMLGESTRERYKSFVGEDVDQAALAAHIHQRTTSTDRVQLWGPRVGLLAAIERPPATRFTDPFLLFCEKDGNLVLFEDCPESRRARIQSAFRDEIMRDLESRPPLYIAAHYADGSLAVADGPCLAPDLPALRALIDSRYVREASFGAWSAFRRRAPP